jgi:hypothetical protein
VDVFAFTAKVPPIMATHHVLPEWRERDKIA